VGTIQIEIDDDLLREIDRLAENEHLGRSGVFEKAIEAYLRRQRKAAIAQQYALAYGAGEALGEEFEGWDSEGGVPPRVGE
jgi:predicted transcriptional regulator